MVNYSNTTPDVSPSGVGSRNEITSARIQTIEHSGIVMISAPLNSNNWLLWSRSVHIVLEGRDKLSFIDGSCARPAAGSVELRQWRITDLTVRTWILNSICKDIVNVFLYTSSTRGLWMELEAHYGECDDTLLYKSQREISSMPQGNMSVTTYYTKLKQLWDELVYLMPTAMCKCGKCERGCNKTKTDWVDGNQLIQFLMGLNKSFFYIRNQILVLERFSKVNKAYSMVLRIERRRQVNLEFAEAREISAVQVRTIEQRGNIEWYKDLNDQRRKNGNAGKAYVVADTEQHRPVDSINYASSDMITELMEALRIVQNKLS
ncbi:UNVERIFIED_CONTAM: hypothetical protein Slati_3429700 [Sesamum latifolium]|uniref:Retrotransposon Copia-like N-terminal domain-containing protein n=1 Tax=Sesamum latifolium TaxID=2727402 RepID=A0AAW2UFP2_9LAMI